MLATRAIPYCQAGACDHPNSKYKFMNPSKQIVLCCILLFTSCLLSHGQHTQRREKYISEKDLPQGLSWGTAVNGVSMAFEFDIANISLDTPTGILATVYLKNDGNTSCYFAESAGQSHGFKALSKDDNGALVEINSSNAAKSANNSGVGHVILNYVAAGKISYIPISLDPKILKAASGMIFMGLNTSAVAPNWNYVYTGGVSIPTSLSSILETLPSGGTPTNSTKP